MLEVITKMQFENRRFTTGPEVEAIKEALDLKNKTNLELHILRNDIVREITEESTPDEWNAMMRATAVIDQEKWSRGMEV